MRRYTKFTGFLNTSNKSFTNNFKKMSNKDDIRREKENIKPTTKNFMQELTEKFNKATHKVSDTLNWVTQKIKFNKNDDTLHQNVKSNIYEKDKPSYYAGDKNPTGEDELDKSFDINKMGGETIEEKSKGNETQGGHKSKLDLKFGGGSSYGSSRIGKYADQKPSNQIPKEEKREYSVPQAGSAMNESGSQASCPINEPDKNSHNIQSDSHGSKDNDLHGAKVNSGENK